MLPVGQNGGEKQGYQKPPWPKGLGVTHTRSPRPPPLHSPSDPAPDRAVGEDPASGRPLGGEAPGFPGGRAAPTPPGAPFCPGTKPAASRGQAALPAPARPPHLAAQQRLAVVVGAVLALREVQLLRVPGAGRRGAQQQQPQRRGTRAQPHRAGCHGHRARRAGGRAGSGGGGGGATYVGGTQRRGARDRGPSNGCARRCAGPCLYGPGGGRAQLARPIGPQGVGGRPRGTGSGHGKTVALRLGPIWPRRRGGTRAARRRGRAARRRGRCVAGRGAPPAPQRSQKGTPPPPRPRCACPATLFPPCACPRVPR